MKHLNHWHKSLWDDAKSNHSFSYNTEFPIAPPSVSELQEPVSGLVFGGNAGLNTPSPPKHVFKVDGSGLYSSVKHAGDKAVLEKFHNLILDFATSNDICERIVTNHKECPQFKNMIMYAINNSKQLSGKQDILPGQYKFGTMRKKMFETLLAAVDWRVRVTRKYWRDIIGHPIPSLLFVKMFGNRRRKMYWELQ